MTTEQQPASPGRRGRILGMSAQTAGAVGIVVSLVMIVLVLLARGWVVDKVDQIAGRVDDGLAKGIPLIDTADERIGQFSARVEFLVDVLETRAANPGPAAEVIQSVLERATEASDRYLELRTTYADARERVGGVMERLNTIDAMIPAISVPQGPVEALTALDARMRELDASAMELIGAIPQVGSGQLAGTIAEKGGRVEAALASASDALDTAEIRLNEVRAEVQSWADRINTAVTIVTLVLILAFLYSALLHWVLYRSGKQLRRGGEGG